METKLQAIGMQVRDLDVIGDHIVGFIADDLIPPSPRAEHVPPVEAFRKLVTDHNLATAVPPFYLQLANKSGFFSTIGPEILTVFLGLDPAESDSAKHFLLDYGLWREGDLYEERTEKAERLSKPVRAWWKDATRRKQTPFATSLSEFWWTRDLAETLNDLRAALLRSDKQRAKALCPIVGEHFIHGYKPSAAVEREANFLLALGTGRMLESARIAPIEENGKLFPVIATGFSRDAVFAQLLLKTVQSNPLYRCKRSDCDKIFVRSRLNKEYCSDHCQALTKRRRQLGKPIEEIERADTSLRRN